MADGNSRIIRRAGLAYALVTFRTKHLVSDLPSMDTFHAVSQDLTMLPTNLSVILKAEGNVASTPSSKKILADVFLGNSSYTISGLDLRAYPVVLRTAEDSPSGKKTLNMLYYLCYLFLFFYSYVGRKESDFFVAVPYTKVFVFYISFFSFDEKVDQMTGRITILKMFYPNL